jgi:hypothetical protein
MYRFSFDAQHISNSRFSVETYMNYRQTLTTAGNPSSSTQNALNIYNLALRYDTKSGFNIAVGRRINPKVTSLGAVDGVQMEKYFGNFYLGAIGGFRPDFTSYGFNKNLLEFGSYAGFKSERQNYLSQTTVGMMEQRNLGNIDRRYAFFQYSSTIGSKLNLYSSIEADLYDGLETGYISTFRLTNLFASVSYRISRAIDLYASYDTRKQILYYETMKTEIEKLLENDWARQGVRLRMNVRPVKFLNFSLSYSKRFQSNDQNSSDNYNGMINLSKLPWMGGGISINYNKNISSYQGIQVFSVRHYRTLVKDHIDSELYYRVANYSYSREDLSNQQTYYGGSIYIRFVKKISFSVLAEMGTQQNNHYYRVNGRISKNF